MRRSFIFFLQIVLMPLALLSYSFAQNNYTHYVNPFIGTGGHGHTFPGATVPFGMVQVSPDTRIDDSWDGCSGYHYSDSLIYGFSHTHLSGTGVSDYGDILLLPLTNEPDLNGLQPSTLFSHKTEKASPGYYAVTIDNHKIDVELTATTRTGMHQYTFHKDGEVYVYLDLNHRDKLTDGYIKHDNDSEVTIFRQSEGWARQQFLYANIQFSKPVIRSKILENKKAVFCFYMHSGEKLLVKTALSAVDNEGAARNMMLENQDWNFENIRAQADQVWNKELSKIKVSSADKNKLIIFYTALYHCMIHPNIYNDVDGRYRGRDLRIHQTDHNYYTVFSLWDTFRAWHPLLSIIDEKRTVDFIRTFLLQYEQGGLLPVWELAANETECMIGYHAVSVIADAMMKGFKGFDYEMAYEACKKSAEKRERYGLAAYIDKGFLETEDEHESVSKTLEYAYDDWCIAQMAKLLNRTEDFNQYLIRSQSWKNLFNPANGFIQPRTNGGWLKSFDPFEVNNHYTEANGWQYNFFVPHDIDGLIFYNGGKQKFEKKLDQLFNASSKTTGRQQSDITGLIGQYAHGNEPSHHIAYLYNYVDKPYKTQALVNRILNKFYTNSPDGLIGNEDCGQMSAWYVLSSIGIYSVCPGSNQYQVTAPQFDKIELTTSEQHVLTIITKNKSASKDFIKIIKHKNIPYRQSAILTHEKLITADTLVYIADSMSNQIVTLDASDKLLYTDTFMRVPAIEAPYVVFKDSMQIKIKNYVRDATTTYLLQGPFERPAKMNYSKPITINQNATIQAFVANQSGNESKWISASYFKLPHPYWKVYLKSSYNPQYHAGGASGLIDGLHGDENWRKGRWQGYQSQDFECVIDMTKKSDISVISATFLQDTRSWILMPLKVDYYTSVDGKQYEFAGAVENNIPQNDYTVQIKSFELDLNHSRQAKYVKVIAKSAGKLPEWHQGYPYGGDAFIFVDEVEIK
jgi:predicted alpha-1,2-mannosidase